MEWYGMIRNGKVVQHPEHDIQKHDIRKHQDPEHEVNPKHKMMKYLRGWHHVVRSTASRH